ncbi:MAG: hypothetical protein IPN71_02355 [Fibrobacteres bacterium]|nr:hypothetical protein [Fibrobacterota bacterium]
MDHQAERNEIRKYILQRIKKLAQTDHEPIRFLQIGYDVDQSKLLCVFFDTRPKAGPDGQWTVHLKGNTKNIAKWGMFDGGDYDKIVPLLGKLLKKCVLELCEEGSFDVLRCARNCDFGIEHMLGDYGWPKYEDRKKKNLLRPKK